MPVSEYIDELVSSQAFEQLQRLSEELETAREEMEKSVQTAARLVQELSKISQVNAQAMTAAMREAAAATTRLEAATGAYTKTESERLNIEREIKREGEMMAKVVESEVEAMKEARRVAAEYSLNMDELTNNIMEDRIELDRLKRQQKELNDEIKQADKDLKDHVITRAEHSKIIQDNTAKLAENYQKQSVIKQGISEEELALKSLVKQHNAALGSYDEMNQELGRMRDAFRQMSEEERNSTAGQILLKGIQQLDDELKALDKSIGNNQRNVGNYEIAGKSLKAQLTDIKNALGQIKMEYAEYGEAIEEAREEVGKAASEHGKGSEEYRRASEALQTLEDHYANLMDTMQEMQEKAGELIETTKEVNAEIAAAGDDNGAVNTFNEGVGALADGFQVAQIAASALGLSTDSLNEVFAKVQMVQSFTKAFTGLTTALNKNSKLMTGLRVLWGNMTTAYKAAATQQKALATSATAMAGAQGKARIATISLTATLKGLGAAIKSIPIIGWILALVSAVISLVSWLGRLRKEKAEKETEEFTKRLEAEKGSVDKVTGSVEALAAKLKALKKVYDTTEKGSDENKTALKALASELGLTEEQVEALGDSLNDYIRILINVKTAEAEVNAQQELLTEAFKRKNQQQQLVNEFMEIHGESDWKKRGAQMQALAKRYGLSEEEGKKFASIAHDNRDVNAAVRELNKSLADVYGNQDAIISTLKGSMQEAVETANAANSELDKFKDKNNNKGGGGMTDAQRRQATEAAKRRAEELERLKEDNAKRLAELEAEAKGEIKIYENKLAEIESRRLKDMEKASGNEEAEKIINARYKLEAAKAEEEFLKKQNDLIDKYNKEALDLLDKMEYEKLLKNKDANGKQLLTEEELTDKLVEHEKERSRARQDVINDDFEKQLKQMFGRNDAELTDIEKQSKLYLALVKRRDAMLIKEAEDTKNAILAIEEEGFTKRMDRLKKEYSHKSQERRISALGSATGEGGKGYLTDKEKQALNMQDMQDSIELAREEWEALKAIEEEKIADKEAYNERLKNAEERYLEAMAAYAEEENNIQKESLEKQKEIRALKLQAAEDIMGSAASILESFAKMAKDEKKAAQLQKAAAAIQAFASIGKAIAVMTEQISADGSPWPVKIAGIVSSVATITAQIASLTAVFSKADAYAEGTDYHHGGPAVVGEAGSPELVQVGGKSFVVDKPTFFTDLPVGAKVIPLEKANTNLAGSVDLAGIEERLDRIGSKSVVSINVGRNVAMYLAQGNGRTRILNSKFKA